MNPGSIYTNLIIHYQIKEKIGYLVYSASGSGFDQELSDVFKEFKSQNTTKLISDLRCNGGGGITSANLMSSCIAGNFYVDKIFVSYRYNGECMKALDDQWSIQKFAYSQYDNLSTSLSAGGLKLQEIYCLATDDSASASELVINALRGTDIEAILTGAITHGKNVGMEGVELTAGTDKYLSFSITFQAYNIKGFGDFEDGSIPSYEINGNQPNGEYFEGYGDFGTESDPLYIKAISLASGNKVTTPTRAVNQAKERVPVIATSRLNHIGMIK